MVQAKKTTEIIERVTLKLPKSVATYFRKTFAHGLRSKFVADCILEYKHDQEVLHIEEELRIAGNAQQ